LKIERGFAHVFVQLLPEALIATPALELMRANST
jgi:hypothetical protein